MKRKHLVLLTCCGLSALAPAFSADSAIANVRRELDPEALFYTHIDLEGGWGKIGHDLSTALKGTSFENRDFSAAFATLGLTDIRAIGMSSAAIPGGYDNRFFLFTPGGRTGLLSVFPGKPERFTAASYAPRDADLVIDSRIDVAALLDTIQTVALQMASDRQETGNMITTLRNELGKDAAPLLKFKGRLAFVLRTSPQAQSEEKENDVPPVAPVELFAWIETGGSAIDQSLSKQKSWTRTESNGQIRFTSDFGEDKMIVIITGEQITAGFPATFVDECLARKDGLATSSDFQQLLSATAAEGHVMTYMTPKFFSAMRDNIPFLSMLATRQLGQSRSDANFTNQIFALLPLPTKPVISVLVARDDGILVRSQAPQSLKESLPFVSLVLPEFLGRIATLGASAWAIEDRHQQSLNKAQSALSGRLQQAGEAAAAYFEKYPAENGPVTLSTLREASPGIALPDFSDVSSHDLEISRHTDVITLYHNELGEITHVMPLTKAQRSQIEKALHDISTTGSEALALSEDDTDMVYASSLIDNGWLTAPVSVAGEDYTTITFSAETTQLNITTPGGQEVIVERTSDERLKALRIAAERQLAVERNLGKLDAAGLQFLHANPDESSITLAELKEKGPAPEITPVKDEDYNELSVRRDQAALTLNSRFIGQVTYHRPLSADVMNPLMARLTAAEKAVSAYFAQNPSADLVLIGEVFKEAAPVQEDHDSAVAVSTADDTSTPAPVLKLSDIIVRRNYKKISAPLDASHTLEVLRSAAQP